MANIKSIFPTGLVITKRKVVLLVLLLVAAAVVAVVLYNNHQNHNNALRAVENRSSQNDQQILFAHDYKGYQLNLTSYADAYTAKGQYGEAERVLNTIINDVPQNQIISDTYRSFWYLYQQNGDSANRKKYATLTAEKLKQEGRAKEATAFEQDANGK